MKTESVELKLQNGTAIKIKGSPDFVATVAKAILEVSKERASDQVEEGEPKESSRAGKLAHVNSVENRELEAGHSVWLDESKVMLVTQRSCRTLRRQLSHPVSGAVSRRPEDHKRLWSNDGVRIRVATLRRERDRIFAEETKKVKRRPN